MNILSRLIFWFENRQGYLKLSRYRKVNTKFYSVLVYHGVENDQRKRIYRPKDISEKAIKNEIDFYLRQGYQICSYVDVKDEKLIPRSNLMLTFDGGHRNIAQTVRHLSRHYQIRPVIAICPGVIESKQPFWFEEIYARLMLTQHNDVHPACTHTHDPQAAYRQVMDFYLGDPALKSEDILSIIRGNTDDVSDAQVQSHPAVHGNLDWAELGSLLKENSCTIATQTMYHESVSHMSTDEFEDDVNQCKQLIQKNLGVECAHFIYPFGVYSNDWESMVLSKCALSFSYVVNDKINTDPQDNYHVTRITGKDFTKEPGDYRFHWHQRHAQLITLK